LAICGVLDANKRSKEAGASTPVIEPGVTVYQAAKMVAVLGLNQDRRKLAAMESS